MQIKYKNFMSRRLNKRLLTVIILIILINLFQLIFRDIISFRNTRIDLFFRYTGPFFLFTWCLMLMYLVIVNTQINGIRILFQVIFVPAAFILLFLIIFTVPVIATPEKDMARYYFMKSGEYRYYIIDESFAGGKPYNDYRIYKERPLINFINERSEVEPDKLNLDRESLEELYRRMSNASLKNKQ